MIEITAFIAFGIVLLIVIALSYMKDSEMTRKFSKYEKILDSLMKENHAIKKQLQTLEITASLPKETEDLQNIEERLALKIQSEINDKIIPVINSIQNIEQAIENFQSEQQDRIYDLEERTKSITKISPPNNGSDEEKIVSLYNNGLSVESIAKDLQLSVGKVNLILKIRGLLRT
ncbi:Putative periplasmic protein [Campylobacter sputorum subsp. bubulus]|uniref:Periplasmic protein n=1 Tax=Campylobacter sputorum subsp. sputorum TaxID=32024 RepID=A0A381DIX4_9BACT|nr:hypothetical protein [Campylobacter sputorum]ASM35658.1 hypothetical protein CSPUT_1473 [Campylobacter sputorum aubsp. sputorum RM3237]ASM37376.1 hypothetical protein CSF_1528 [Campylobacter sputorum bv. faecalis CCUG 20703]ASM39041.1 hypothetical protein CSPARA_1498 [Campylobacter sputorum bv. paraureolyticus LMG 11764]KAB0582612.1 hypothetical protein F7P64_00255 [Campylobacter sputorum subsp. sputorum]MDY6120345.1 hypothetical protein [Campylobacter sputorum]